MTVEQGTETTFEKHIEDSRPTCRPSFQESLLLPSGRVGKHAARNRRVEAHQVRRQLQALRRRQRDTLVPQEPARNTSSQANLSAN